MGAKRLYSAVISPEAGLAKIRGCFYLASLIALPKVTGKVTNNPLVLSLSGHRRGRITANWVRFVKAYTYLYNYFRVVGRTRWT